MSFDFERIREKFLRSKKYWNKLRGMITKTSEEIERDFDSQLISERLFEVLSQTLLDICTHIIAQSNEETPQSYSDCMKKLEKLGVIKLETSEKLVSLIKMRNIIVHQYGEINYQFLYEGLRELYEAFPIFEEEILEWIELKVSENHKK